MENPGAQLVIVEGKCTLWDPVSLPESYMDHALALAQDAWIAIQLKPQQPLLWIPFALADEGMSVKNNAGCGAPSPVRASPDGKLCREEKAGYKGRLFSMSPTTAPHLITTHLTSTQG